MNRALLYIRPRLGVNIKSEIIVLGPNAPKDSYKGALDVQSSLYFALPTVKSAAIVEYKLFWLAGEILCVLLHDVYHQVPLPDDIKHLVPKPEQMQTPHHKVLHHGAGDNGKLDPENTFSAKGMTFVVLEAADHPAGGAAVTKGHSPSGHHR